MGNMSNPSVNRWGLNTFWYKFWYSDKTYSQNFAQDEIFTRLINTYLFFGLNVFKNFFWNSYWFYTNRPQVNNLRYFRWIPAKQTPFGITPGYRLRVTIIDVYLMKVWILRYAGWFIFNLYWFQPLKVNEKRAAKRRFHKLDQFSLTGTPDLSRVRRLKTLLSYSFVRHFKFKKLYRF